MYPHISNCVGFGVSYHHASKYLDDDQIRLILIDIVEMVDVPIVLSNEWYDMFLDKIPVILNDHLEMRAHYYMTEIEKSVNKYGVITLVKDIREEYPDFQINFDDYEADIYISLVYHMFHWYFTEWIEDILNEYIEDTYDYTDEIETRLENYFYEFLNE